MGCGASIIRGGKEGTPALLQKNDEEKKFDRPERSQSRETTIGADPDKLKSLREKRQTQRLIQNLVNEHVGKSVHEMYDTGYGHVLGSGISGTVRAVRHKRTGIEYAMKTLSKARVKTDKKMQELKNEITVMSEVDHPNIIRLMDVFETDHHIFLIIELCTGGELLQRLQSQPHYHYSEITASQIVRKIVSAVKYLHNQHIVHRDLKLENFLFDSRAPGAELKLIDFGFSRHFEAGGPALSVPVGTPFYVAPEVLKGAYDHKCDIWSIGVITYMLLSGRPAFYGDNQKAILEAVKRGKYEFPDEIFRFVSPLAKDFIARLLVVDVARRPSAEEVHRHPWLARHADRPEAAVSPQVVQSLKDFQRFSKLKRVALEVIAYSLRPDQIRELRAEFAKVDQSESGEITFEDLETACKNSGLIKPGDMQLIFESMDIDKTGKIHWIEFLAATLEKSALDEESIRAAFGRIDTDNKGYITAEELRHLVGVDMTEAQVHEMVEEASAREGRITCDKFVEMIKGASTKDGTASRRFLWWNLGAGQDFFRRVSMNLRSRLLSQESSDVRERGDSASDFLGRLRGRASRSMSHSQNGAAAKAEEGGGEGGSGGRLKREASVASSAPSRSGRLLNGAVFARYKRGHAGRHQRHPLSKSAAAAALRHEATPEAKREAIRNRTFTSPEAHGAHYHYSLPANQGRRVDTCPDVDDPLLPAVRVKRVPPADAATAAAAAKVVVEEEVGGEKGDGGLSPSSVPGGSRAEGKGTEEAKHGAPPGGRRPTHQPGVAAGRGREAKAVEAKDGTVSPSGSEGSAAPGHGAAGRGGSSSSPPPVLEPLPSAKKKKGGGAASAPQLRGGGVRALPPSHTSGQGGAAAAAAADGGGKSNKSPPSLSEEKKAEAEEFVVAKKGGGGMMKAGGGGNKARVAVANVAMMNEPPATAAAIV